MGHISINIFKLINNILFREEDGKAWITFKQQGQLGIHAKIISEGESKDGESFNLSCDDEEFNLSEITSKSFSISHSKAKSLNFKIIRPEMTFSSIHSKNVGALFMIIICTLVMVIKDGFLLSWPAKTHFLAKSSRSFQGLIFELNSQIHRLAFDYFRFLH